MVVSASSVAGTIGGGRLEWDAIGRARAMLEAGEPAAEEIVALGPAIGQCCGGRVTLGFDRPDVATVAAAARDADAEAAARPCVHIYGAGHVGRALARALSPLPLRTTLIDGRPGELAGAEAPGVALLESADPAATAEAAPDGAAHVVMTHSHALDSLIAAAVLERDRFAYLGVIGSRAKRIAFRRAFRAMGIAEARIARMVCPIGGEAVRDKRPEVIAALVAAEIVTTMLGRQAEIGRPATKNQRLED
jgi:xanthine dehydrogenase accessory factor